MEKRIRGGSLGVVAKLTLALGLTVAMAGLTLSAGVAGASSNGNGNGNGTNTTSTTINNFTYSDIGGSYVCSLTRTVKTAGKAGGVKDTQDTETCTLSDISLLGAGTYTGVLTKLAPPWGPSLVGTMAAVYYYPNYPLYPAGTVKNGVNVGGQQVPWIWHSDYDNAIATAITFTITANSSGDGGGTLDLVAHFNH